MIQSTLTAKGQTTLPKEIRDRLGLKPGDTVEYLIESTGLVRILPAKRPITALRGMLGKPPNGPATLEQMDQGIADAITDRHARSLRSTDR